MSGNAIPMSGKDKIEICTLNPNKVMIHAVIVVPMLAPKMTPTDFASGSKPAFTKLTTITVVADDDCMIAVINNPVKTPVNRLEVMEDNIPRMPSPATFCKASLIIFIPSKKRPSEPTIVSKLKIKFMIWAWD